MIGPLRDNHWHAGGGVAYFLPQFDRVFRHLHCIRGGHRHAMLAARLPVSIAAPFA